ncbi:MAG: sialate O-acetylesterase [Planctomycetota bacterium]|jgi:hypothetical protein
MSIRIRRMLCRVACSGVVAVLVMLTARGALAGQAGRSPVKVFILAGQSNMEGQGVVDLDHPQYYNGGRGILNTVMKDPAKARLFRHLKDAAGKWVVRDDVRVDYKTRHEHKKGGLTIGFTGYGGTHHIGPELQFGHVIGDHVDEPVFLIKTAWGGKSLYKDFRPPSSGGDVGPYYTQMLAEVQGALARIREHFPDSEGHEIAGFVWFQGWNDMCDKNAIPEYEENLVNLIKDIRKEWGVADLPVVVGELGNGGPKASGNMLAIRKAQAGAVAREEFKGNAVFIETNGFARPKEDSPNKGHGHHWFGNAESYFLIGGALGEGMKGLLEKRAAARGPVYEERALPDEYCAGGCAAGSRAMPFAAAIFIGAGVGAALIGRRRKAIRARVIARRDGRNRTGHA